MGKGKFRISRWRSGTKKSWAMLAQQVDGCTFNSHGFGLSFTVTKDVGDWSLHLSLDSPDGGQTINTRVHASFLNPHKLRISMRRTGRLGFLYQRLTRQTYKSGVKKIDQAFTMYVNDPSLMRQYLSNEEVSHLLLRQPHMFHLEIKDNLGVFREPYGEHVNAICITVPGFIRNIDHLKSLFLLAERLLSSNETSRQAAVPQSSISSLSSQKPKSLVHYHREELEPVLAFFGGRIEEQGDRFKARFSHPDEIVTSEATLDIGIPTLPAYASDICFSAPHPPLEPTLSLRTKKSVLGALNLTGRARDINAGFNIDHKSEHEIHLQFCHDELMKMIPFDCHIELSGHTFKAKISAVSGFDLKECVYTLLELWRKSARHAAGF